MKHSWKQKLLSTVLFALLLISAANPGVFYIYAQDAAAQDREAFSQAALALIRENWEDSYFSSIALQVGSATMYVDGREQTLSAAPQDEGGTLLLPAADIAQALGEETAEQASGGILADGSGNSRLSGGFSDNLLSGAQDLQEALGLSVETEGENILLTKPFQTKQLIVRTKTLHSLKEAYGATDVLSDGHGSYFLQFASEEDAQNAYPLLSQQRGVESVCANGVLHTDTTDIQVSALAQSADAEERWSTERISASLMKTRLQDLGITNDITVAVLDTGVDTEHSDFTGRAMEGKDFVYDLTPDDRKGHGTHVAGTVVDCTPSNVKIMPVKILDNTGYGDEFTISQGIRYAVDNGAAVLNLSLSGYCNDSNCLIKQAVDYAYTGGVSVVVAAGNENTGTQSICPAKLTHCVTVASVDSNDVRASKSNFGSAVDIAAPGVNVPSAYPGNQYAYMSGTSMATPHVSAAAAMLKLAHSGYTPAQIEQTVCASAIDRGDKGKDSYYGTGVLDLSVYLGITVQPGSVHFAQPELELTVYGNSYYSVAALDVTVKPLNARDRSYTVTSSDESILSISGSQYTIHKLGEVMLTATAANGVTAVCPVSVKQWDSNLWIESAADTFDGGDGSQENPYQIATPKQLAKLAYDVCNGAMTYENYYFRLTSDIDLAGKLWTPIAVPSYLPDLGNQPGFSGHLDGDNHSIRNMSLVASGYYSNIYRGLFGFLNAASVRNLSIVNAQASSASYQNCNGILAGYARLSAIENCYTNGSASGGGLIGTAQNTTIQNCFTTAKCGGAGFVYESNASVIRNCYAAGQIQYGSSSAGFVYKTEGADNKIINSFSANVLPKGGGFLYQPLTGTLQNCYLWNENARPGGTAASFQPNELTKESHAFFCDASAYAGSGWSEAAPWDFTSVWAIDPAINDGLPYLKTLTPPIKIQAEATDSWQDYAAPCYAGGSGAADDPFQIESAAQLARLSLVYQNGGGENQYFCLTADIDLSAHAWLPIAGISSDIYLMLDSRAFNGHISGAGHTVNGLNSAHGFIRLLQDSSVTDLHFTNCMIQSSAYSIGGIVNYSHSSQIIGCSVRGSVAGPRHVGGICGYAFQSEILDCTVDATVSGDLYVGGITAVTDASNILRCRISGHLSSFSATHGAIAAINKGLVQDCFASGLTGADTTGLVQQDAYGKISRSLFLGKEKNYLYGTVRNAASGEEKTMIQLQDESLYADWDFAGVWQLDAQENNGIPTLQAHAPAQVQLLPSTLWSDYAAAVYAGGNGSEHSPYLIETAEQLAKLIVDYRDGSQSHTYYKLMRDIDLAAHLWQTVGWSAVKRNLYLSFDGNNKKISNLTQWNGNGFLGVLGSFLQNAECTIYDLRLENVNGSVQAPFVIQNHGTIRNCSASGSFIGGAGLLATNEGTVTACYSECTVRGIYAAGLAFYNHGSIENCYFTGSVSGEYSELLVGIGTDFGTVKNCYAAAEQLGSREWNQSPLLKFTNVYYDGELAGHTQNNGNSRTSEQMQQKNTYQGWDFGSVWQIDRDVNDGYPYLLTNPPCTHLLAEDAQILTEVTCTQDGLQSGMCTLCGKTVTKTIPRTLHTYNEWTTKAATCTTDGSRFKSCAVCGDKVTETLTASGHTYSEWTTKAATCTANGSRSKSCGICGDKVTETLTAGGHSYSEWTVKAATCTANGSRSKSCSACGDKITEPITKLGHDSGKWETATAATTTKDGKKELRCTRCKVVLKTEVLPKNPNIKLNKKDVTLGVKETFTPTATTDAAITVTWSSSNKAIATVDVKSGKITAVKAGFATVTATTAMGKKANITVTVKAAPKSVTLNKSSVTLGVKESFTPTVKLAPADSASYKRSWSSANKNIAAVDASGKITGVKAGNTTVMLTLFNGVKVKIAVTVKAAPKSVTLNKSSVTLGVKESFTPTVKLAPADSASYKRSWSSTNKNIAAVDASGKITGVKVGNTTVTLTLFNGVKVKIAVTVKAAPKSVTLNKSSVTLKKGEAFVIKATPNSGAASNKITYSVKDSSIVSVSASGKITAKKKGSTTVTVKTFNNETAVCKVTVK